MTETTEEKRPVGRPKKEETPSLRLQIAATIVAGVAAQGTGRVKEVVMVDRALALADMLLERAK